MLFSGCMTESTCKITLSTANVPVQIVNSLYVYANGLKGYEF